MPHDCPARLIAIGDIHGEPDQSKAYRTCSSESDIEIFLFNGGKQTLRT